MFSLGWIADYPDPQNFLDIKFHSDSRNNETGYSNPEVDELLDQARARADEQHAHRALPAGRADHRRRRAVDRRCTTARRSFLVKPYVKGYFSSAVRHPQPPLRDHRPLAGGTAHAGSGSIHHSAPACGARDPARRLVRHVRPRPLRAQRLRSRSRPALAPTPRRSSASARNAASTTRSTSSTCR